MSGSEEYCSISGGTGSSEVSGKKFGTPYEIAYPLAEELVPEWIIRGKKILIVQQQVIANAMRRGRCQKKNPGKKEAITAATWFMRKEEILTDLNLMP